METVKQLTNSTTKNVTSTKEYETLKEKYDSL